MSKRDHLKYLGFATAAVVATKLIQSMSKEDYRLLELLLGKLEMEIGNMICIIPGYIQDGYHIGVYDRKSGEPHTGATGPSIESVVEKLKQQSTPTNDTTTGNKI